MPFCAFSGIAGAHKKLVVVGDLHGQLADLLTIFLEHGFPDPEGTAYVFNGDFVDRGAEGVEVVMLLLGYQLLYPDSVHLNRGNHEDPDQNMTGKKSCFENEVWGGGCRGGAAGRGGHGKGGPSRWQRVARWCPSQLGGADVWVVRHFCPRLQGLLSGAGARAPREPL